MSSEGPHPLVAMAGIGKSFGGRSVLERVDLKLAGGEVHALLGENGAGKSTLMNVLAGLYAADAGTIAIEGRLTAIRGPRDAQAAGVGMVHQHFRLVPAFTATENLLLAAGGRRDLRTVGQAVERLETVAAATGLVVRTGVPVRDLAVAEQQRVEIVKILALGARILILDEPTAVLTDPEAARLLEVVRGLGGQGLGVVLITHKLREVTAGADRVSVMRAGSMVLAAAPVADVDRGSLARLMVGDLAEAADGLQPIPRARSTRRDERLVVAHLGVRASDHGTPLAEISLTVRAGEIVGIAGVGGNGQEQLAEALMGLRAVDAGTIAIDGAEVTRAAVWRRRVLGLRYVPADRRRSGLAGDLSVADNLAMLAVRAGRYGRLFQSARRLRRAAAALIDRYAIAGATAGRAVRLLSGGNAQKVVLARELDGSVSVLIAHSPTRGLDVAATGFVHDRLAATAAQGAAILLLSEDLEEVLALSDRVLVMSRGRIVGERGANPPRAEIGALMLGHA